MKKSRGFIIKQATGMDIICLIIENTKKRRALWLIHHADLVCNRNEKREEALPKERWDPRVTGAPHVAKMSILN